MPSEVKIISLNELENMHIGSLMSRRKKLLACEESFELSDRFGNENEPALEETGYIKFKNSTAWKKAYKELKLVLSTREHYGKSKE
jgi:hypothetical protein